MCIRRSDVMRSGAGFFKTLMNKDFFEWIDAHKGDDPGSLWLKYGKTHASAITQVECRRRFGAKLSRTLADDPQFLFPNTLAGEQSTSDVLASFHSSLIEPGCTVADFTAGLGIDAMAMARHAAHVTAVEMNPEVAEALVHNSRYLSNLDVVCADCREYAESVAAEGKVFDTIFIDPARRDKDGGRTYALADCSPDIVAMLPLMRRITHRVIVKASPMLDIAHTINELDNVTGVIILGTPGECKELDVVIDFGAKVAEPVISAVTLTAEGISRFDFTRSEEAATTPRYGLPKTGDYILEPYPAVMKAGVFRLLSARYGLQSISANTHLWHSEAIPDGFPGKSFLITDIQEFASKNIKRYAASHPRVSVTVRNFDMSAEALRAKLRVRDGEERLFAIGSDEGRLLVTATPC